MKAITYANLLTFFRILLIMPFLYFLSLKYPNVLNINEFYSKLISLVIFIIGSITDYLDGYFARNLKEQSLLGKFLDPLADKFLVSSALIAFLNIESTLFPHWMVFTVITREITITILRINLISQSQNHIQTLLFAKIKTISQIITIIAILCFFVLKSYYYPAIQYPSHISLVYFLSHFFQNSFPIVKHIPITLMLITTLITVASGFQYFWQNRTSLFNQLKS